jgi:hypothetical protein
MEVFAEVIDIKDALRDIKQQKQALISKSSEKFYTEN